MHVVAEGLPGNWGVAAYAAVAVAGGIAACRAPWWVLLDSARSHLFFASCLGVMALWCLHPPVAEARFLHLSGATMLTLTFGAPLALVALGIASLGLAVIGQFPAESWATGFLLAGVVPVTASWALLRLAERFLPAHFFVYVFGPAFAGAALAMCAGVAASWVTVAAFGAPVAAQRAMAGLPFGFLLAFAEATLTGMAITLLAVYRPRWLGTFDDRRYLSPR